MALFASSPHFVCELLQLGYLLINHDHAWDKLDDMQQVLCRQLDISTIRKSSHHRVSKNNNAVAEE